MCEWECDYRYGIGCKCIIRLGRGGEMVLLGDSRCTLLHPLFNRIIDDNVLIGIHQC